MSSEEFVSEMQGCWRKLYKRHPQRADLLSKRISVSSPLYCKSETVFRDTLMGILHTEINQQILDFVEGQGDWKKIRDLLNLAHASR